MISNDSAPKWANSSRSSRHVCLKQSCNIWTWQQWHFSTKIPGAHHVLVVDSNQLKTKSKRTLTFKEEGGSVSIKGHSDRPSVKITLHRIISAVWSTSFSPETWTLAPPRWRVETTGSQRETVAEWTRPTRVLFRYIEDRSALSEHLQRNQSCSEWSVSLSKSKMTL